MRLLKQILGFVLALTMACSLAACTSAPAATTGESTQAEEAAPTEAAAAAETQAPVAGGTMMISAAMPTTLSWYEIRGIMAVAFQGYWYETIMRYGADGTPEPFLVESMTPDPAALTWTLVLRDGITFSDGSALDAEALAWNLDIYKEKGILSGSFFKNYDHAEAVDAKTVVCHFSAWDALFNYSLCRTVLVASKQAFDTNGEDWLKSNPVGTGPFTIGEFTADVSMKLVRNDNYWQGPAYLDEVDLVYYAEELVAATALQTGEVDALVTENYSLVQQLSANTELQKNNVALPSYAYTLCYNCEDPADPFSNRLVREAASYAIDTKSILDTLTYGYAVETNQWAPESSPFYNDDVQAQPYDLEKARSLMAEAGYADGFSTTLTYTSADLISSVAQMIQQQLAAIGIELTLQPIEGAAYVNYIGGWEQGMLLHTMGMEAGAASQYTTTFINDIAFGLGMNAFVISDELNAEALAIANSTTDEELVQHAKNVAKTVFDEDVLCKVVLVTQGVSFVRPEIKNQSFCAVQNLRGDVWQTWIEE